MSTVFFSDRPSPEMFSEKEKKSVSLRHFWRWQDREKRFLWVTSYKCHRNVLALTLCKNKRNPAALFVVLSCIEEHARTEIKGYMMSQKRKSKAGLDRHYKFEVLLNALFDIKNSKYLQISNLFFRYINSGMKTNKFFPTGILLRILEPRKAFLPLFRMAYRVWGNSQPTSYSWGYRRGTIWSHITLSGYNNTTKSRETERASGVMDCVGPALAHDIRDTFSVAI